MPGQPSDIDVLVSEVGPRDGLQSIARVMSTKVKHRWIEALAGSGVREIEVGSFVSPSCCRRWRMPSRWYEPLSRSAG